MIAKCSASRGVVSNTSFQGRFIGERNIKSAVKLSQKFYSNRCIGDGIKIDPSKFNEFAERGKNIAEILKELASKLPKGFDLILDKEKNLEGYKTFCLNLRHKVLGKQEVFCKDRHLPHISNVTRGILHDAGTTLDYLERATNGIENLKPLEMIESYLGLFGERTKGAIKEGSGRNISKKLKVLKNLSEGSLKSENASKVANSINYVLKDVAAKKAIKRENSKFLLRKFFGLE